eukprot:s1385_g26.t1
MTIRDVMFPLQMALETKICAFAEKMRQLRAEVSLMGPQAFLSRSRRRRKVCLLHVAIMAPALACLAFSQVWSLSFAAVSKDRFAN